MIRELTLAGHIQPVFAGSGREHIGIQPLLDGVTYYLPSPLDRPPVTGSNPRKDDKEEKRKPDPREPFCGLVFKIVADTHGELYYVRIYSGTVKANSQGPQPADEHQGDGDASCTTRRRTRRTGRNCPRRTPATSWRSSA